MVTAPGAGPDPSSVRRFEPNCELPIFTSGDTSVVSPFCVPFPNSFGGNLLYALDHVRWKRSFSATGVGVCRGDVRWQHHGPSSSTGEATKRCNVQSRAQRTNHCYGRVGWVCVAVGRCITLKPLSLQAWGLLSLKAVTEPRRWARLVAGPRIRPLTVRVSTLQVFNRYAQRS